MAKYATIADLDEDLKRGLELSLVPDERFLGEQLAPMHFVQVVRYD
ncbi:hypothetical protein ACFFQF_32560 [Haladaptatus pallidirubidus]